MPSTDVGSWIWGNRRPAAVVASADVWDGSGLDGAIVTQLVTQRLTEEQPTASCAHFPGGTGA